ncbi:hypothetical protein HPG69_002121 [Diceros bicornis minor]|uniref:Ig-like domain-containing protein n=1 Tax=Diceros bicornis minor TaxID=77932 RepID=A0A7J7FC76_DICBM|nr:hypothetical protein HPG69_002121 [Diceros bicornis minor]
MAVNTQQKNRDQQWVKQNSPFMSVQEGGISILNCDYNNNMFDYFVWYRKYPVTGPAFLMSIYSGVRSQEVEQSPQSLILQEGFVIDSDTVSPGASGRIHHKSGEGSSIAQNIIQVQTTITRREGETVTMNCKYEISWGRYDDFYWYKQPPSGEMVFLIYHDYSKPNAKQDCFSVNFQSAKKFISLIISPLQLADSATYFCALLDPTVIEMTVEDNQKP